MATDEKAAKILLVDDEQDLLDLLGYNLKREGYEVKEARNGVEALYFASTDPPDVIVLDIMMPRMDGLEFCRRIRQDAYLRHTPILLLTARTEDTDQVEGLDTGADDYLSKPVSPRVLLSRVRALLRRSHHRMGDRPATLRVRNLEIDRDRYIVTRHEGGRKEDYRLPRKEFELLHYLASHPGKVFSRQDLLDKIWGLHAYVVDRTVDVHIRKIREKIGSDFIETVIGVGYRFTE